ncbi:MAG: sugar-binding transcriptional regulator [Moorellaceae bacterium]
MDVKKIVRIARLYYEVGLTQEQIAQQEGVSRATISRALDAAFKQGIIEIRIKYPMGSVEELEEELMRRFKLKKAVVVPVIVPHQEIIKKDVGRAVARFLATIVRSGDIIGISWGTTMAAVAEQLERTERVGVTIVQLNGGVGKSTFSTNASMILDCFAKAFSATPYSLPVPAIVDSPEIAKSIMSDSRIKGTLDLGEDSRIAIFGIGRASVESILFKSGYFSKEEYEALLSKGAVGDICSRFFDIGGRICDATLDARTIGVSLDKLKDKDYSIAVAAGEEKSQAVLGALHGGYFNCLFIDENTARKALQDMNKGEHIK